ncbi:MAG: hypothetical protein ABIK61_05360 [candidate division WOR-3 bacterium]
MLNMLIQQLENEFGIAKSIFKKYDFIVQKDKIYLMTKRVRVFNKIKSYRKGILFAQKLGKTWNLSDKAIQIFGKYATKNIVELNQEQIYQFMRNQKSSQIPNLPMTSGKRFILTYRKYPVGIY